MRQLKEHVLKADLRGSERAYRAVRLRERSEQLAVDIRAVLRVYAYLRVSSFVRLRAAVEHTAYRPDNTHELLSGSVSLKQQPRLTPGTFEQLIKRAVCREVPAAENDEPVAGCGDLRKDMGAENDRVLFPEGRDKLAQLNDLLRIKADGRLVQNQQRRVADECLRKSDALAVAL